MAITDYNVLHITRFSSLTKWSAHDTVFENMDNRFPLVPLSKVLKRVKEPVNIDDGTLYKRITVRLYGQGVLQRDKIDCDYSLEYELDGISCKTEQRDGTLRCYAPKLKPRDKFISENTPNSVIGLYSGEEDRLLCAGV